MKKRIFILFVIIMILQFWNKPETVKAYNLDEIEEYTIQVEPTQTGSAYIKYTIKWKVIDSDTNGPLSWIKVGIPNQHVDEIVALSPEIRRINYYKEDGADYVRIELKDKVYQGKTIDIIFVIHQHQLYKKSGNERHFDFTPGWFEDIEVKKLNIYWRNENVRYAFGEYNVVGDYYCWTTQLGEGEKYTVKLRYDEAVFSGQDNVKVKHKKPVKKIDINKYVDKICIYLFAGLIIIVFIFVDKLGILDPFLGLFGSDDNNSSGFGGGSHGGSSGGGGCACACACAGGGRAGCSKKDFYGTKIETLRIREMIKQGRNM